VNARTQRSAFQFDGVDDEIVTNLNPNLDNGRFFTFEAVYKVLNTNFGAGNDAIISNYQSSSTPNVRLHIRDTGQVQFQVRNSNAVSGDVFSSSIDDGSFHHIVAVANDSNIIVYIDGVEVGTDERPGGVVSTGQNIIIASGHVGRHHENETALARIYLDHALSSSQVQDRFDLIKWRFGI
jgi:hypothetical protein